MTWYEKLFAQEDPARLVYAESESSRRQVDFIIEKLALQPGARILDLCCGQGRHLLDLIRRGYDVTGVDLSDYMLGECKEAAAREGLEPRLIRCDMREIDFDAEFDAAINMWTSFGYLESDEEDQNVLNAVSRALKPGAAFLIDLIHRDALMRRFQERDWQENENGDIVLRERNFNPITGRNEDKETVIYADGRRVERLIFCRLYTYQEMDRMLAQAGLAIEAAYGDFEGSEFTFASRRMILLARKPV